MVFAGGADKLVHPNDLHRLMLKLSNVILVVEDEKYGHLDFLWGKVRSSSPVAHGHVRKQRAHTQSIDVDTLMQSHPRDLC